MSDDIWLWLLLFYFGGIVAGAITATIGVLPYIDYDAWYEDTFGDK